MRKLIKKILKPNQKEGISMAFEDFHERATNIITDTNSSVVSFFKYNLVNIITVILLFTGAIMMSRANNYINTRNNINNAIQSFLSENNESQVDKIDGISYQTNDGFIKTMRVVSTNDIYRFYFHESASSEPFVYSESNKRWVGEEMTPFPTLSEAFVYFDIGLIDSIDDNLAIVDNEEFTVTYELDKVTIEGVGDYAPLPPLKPRTIRFIKQYLEISNMDDVRYVSSQTNSDYETIYFTFSDKLFRLRSYHNGKAQIGLVSKGEEVIIGSE